MRILVVEDAARLSEIIVRRMREEGYATEATSSGTEAVRLAATVSYDAIVLDLRLPDLDGLEVCSRVRELGCWTPILMLTARGDLEDRVNGLDRGADDYLTKPFEFPELFARLRALVRRGSAERPATLSAGDLHVDPAAHTVSRAGVPIELTTKEFALLEYLMRNRCTVLSRERLIEAAWDGSYRGDSNIVDVYIGRLRDKIDRPFDRESLTTVRGVGYRLLDDEHVSDIA
ncbi:MAG: two-component system, OmpR family, response regulator [Gaiellales bacterium]|jgi:two-component system OmpR family response regulator|nr:two-component system, OmpR family, response regulator [Gaiellales bacterium]MDX6550274.1 two-component system, OmpR family, response regulator [Gaiellales bacterium]